MKGSRGDAISQWVLTDTVPKRPAVSTRFFQDSNPLQATLADRKRSDGEQICRIPPRRQVKVNIPLPGASNFREIHQ
jgi:hypothetical protein